MIRLRFEMVLNSEIYKLETILTDEELEAGKDRLMDFIMISTMNKFSEIIKEKSKNFTKEVTVIFKPRQEQFYEGFTSKVPKE